MATRKAYNSTDSENRLMFVEKSNENFGGYRIDLLVEGLTPLEIENYVCTKCKGVMVNACQIGKEQTPMCHRCAELREDVLPMYRPRKRILNLECKCPLYTRGCLWQGKLEGMKTHLEDCEEFIIECPNNCEVFIKGSELGDHLIQCQTQIVKCEYCAKFIVFQDIEPHYGECPDYPLECQKCLLSHKRREAEAHALENCWRIVGSKDRVKKGQPSQHRNENKLKHLKSEFTQSQLDQVKLTYAGENLQLLNQIEELSKEKRGTAREVYELKQMVDEQEIKITTQVTKQKEVDELLGHKTEKIVKLTKRLDEHQGGKKDEILGLSNRIEEQQFLIQTQFQKLDEITEKMKGSSEEIIGLRKNFEKQQIKMQNKHNEFEQILKKKTDEIGALRNKVQEQKNLIQKHLTKQNEMETMYQKQAEAMFGQIPIFYENVVGCSFQEHFAKEKGIHFMTKNNSDEIVVLKKKIDNQQNNALKQIGHQNEVEEKVNKNSREIVTISKKLEGQRTQVPSDKEFKEILKENAQRLDAALEKIGQQQTTTTTRSETEKLNELANAQKKQSEEMVVNSKAVGEQHKMIQFLTKNQNDLGESMKRKSQEMVEFARKLDKQKMAMQTHIFEVEKTFKGEIDVLNYTMEAMQRNAQAPSYTRIPRARVETQNKNPENMYPTQPKIAEAATSNHSDSIPTGPPHIPPPPPKDTDNQLCKQF